MFSEWKHLSLFICWGESQYRRRGRGRGYSWVKVLKKAKTGGTWGEVGGLSFIKANGKHKIKVSLNIDRLGNLRLQEYLLNFQFVHVCICTHMCTSVHSRKYRWIETLLGFSKWVKQVKSAKETKELVRGGLQVALDTAGSTLGWTSRWWQAVF